MINAENSTSHAHCKTPNAMPYETVYLVYLLFPEGSWFTVTCLLVRLWLWSLWLIFARGFLMFLLFFFKERTYIFGIWRIKLRSSYLPGWHFTNWIISPAPKWVVCITCLVFQTDQHNLSHSFVSDGYKGWKNLVQTQYMAFGDF